MLVALALAGATASAAAAVEVNVRVEGATSTLLEANVEATVHPVDGGDGTGPHACRGPIGEIPGPTVTGALDDALLTEGSSWRGEWSSNAGDFLVTSIAGEVQTSTGPWTILLNGSPTPVGGCSIRVSKGDRVLFARDVVFATMTLGLSGPVEVMPGEEFGLFVGDDRNGGIPVAGAQVRSGERTNETDGLGVARFRIEEVGRYTFKATHPDGIRSNAFAVCVGTTGCDENSVQVARIIGLTDGASYMRNAYPTTFRGITRGDLDLRLAVNFKGYRGRCRALRPGRGGMVKRNCRKKPRWFDLQSKDGRWDFSIGRLPPGWYRMFVRLKGSDGKPWRAGSNRIDFRILSRRFSRRALVSGAVGYLDRQVRSSEVRSSRLLGGWSGLALGLHGRRSARVLLPQLRIDRPRTAGTSDLARGLAAIVSIRSGRADAGMKQALISRQQPDGSFESNANLTAMATLALRGSAAAGRAATWLADVQMPQGGFSASAGGPPDVDTTGLVAWALARSGYEEAATRAAAFVKGVQNPDGGFPAVSGGSSNAQSTGFGLLAIHSISGPPSGPPNTDGITPAHYLATLQRRDGAIDYAPGMRTTPVWVTAQAILGLIGHGRLIGDSG